VRSPRILHAPLDVGGHARQLSLAERELGLDSEAAVYAPQSYGFEADIDLRAGIDVPIPVRMARRAAFLRRALDRYDVFHFNFGQTLLQVRQLGRILDELPLLKRRGKTILVTYQGCDVRPFADCYCRNRSCARTTAYRAPAAARVLRHADRVFHLNPDLGRYLPGSRFLPYANVDPRSYAPAPPEPAPAGPLLVVHAPTDRAVKGTAHVIQAVQALQAEGLSIRLELLEGMTRSEVVARTMAADVVVDQLLIGWYGGFAVEAMAMAKPVLCFIREEDNPFGERLPVLRADPATIAARLRDLAGDRDALREAGLAGRRFAEHEHDPLRIARSVLDGLVDLPAQVSPVGAPAR
jgi:hypothetical protein